MRKVMILSTATVMRQFEGTQLKDISFYHFSKEIFDYMRSVDIVLIFDEKNFRELKQRFSTETNRTFPLHDLSIYLERWSK